jgi:hypothetical protein
MKTLLLTVLTTALLSFNSFADSTSDIQNVANEMAKENLQQMNATLTTSIETDIKMPFNFTRLVKNIEPAELNNKKSMNLKNITQASDE